MRRNHRDGQISVDIDGKTYTGSYTIDGGLITVSYDLLAKTTQVGNTPVEGIAKLLLFELVGQERAAVARRSPKGAG